MKLLPLFLLGLSAAQCLWTSSDRAPTQTIVEECPTVAQARCPSKAPSAVKGTADGLALPPAMGVWSLG